MTAVVAATYLRIHRDIPPDAKSGLNLITGLGIDGDCHASHDSPRQILLAASGDYSNLNIAENSLRENILVRLPRLEWQSGSEVRIGKDVRLRITFPCEPCAKLNRYRPGLMKESMGSRGLLARVIQGGRVEVGDKVSVLPAKYAPLAADWRLRLFEVLGRIPDGCQLSYSDLARAVGVHKSYCRVFPRMLRGHARIRIEEGPLVVVGRGPSRAVTNWDSSVLFAGEG